MPPNFYDGDIWNTCEDSDIVPAGLRGSTWFHFLDHSRLDLFESWVCEEGVYSDWKP